MLYELHGEGTSNLKMVSIKVGWFVFLFSFDKGKKLF